MNTEQRSQSPTSRRYDEEFKRSAVEMVESGMRGIAQLAGELGVSTKSLRDWRKLYGRTAAGAGPTGGGGPAPAAALPQDLAEEVRRLRRELEAVSRQRDILKKACAILGQEPGNASR